VASAGIRAMRAEAGLSWEGYTICHVPAEPLTGPVVDGLKQVGIADIVQIGPWLSTPWDVEKWIDDGDDIRRIDVKKKAMVRFAETVLRKYPD
ncbi:MAG TPA: hypothetical protein VMU17_01505, partial [Elusimicrobiota bacterium]|nr:hypothetical protein [Elusimicrobiota bacterium]